MFVLSPKRVALKQMLKLNKGEVQGHVESWSRERLEGADVPVPFGEG